MTKTKRPEELLHIMTASAINDNCFDHILDFIKAGLTEIEIADEIEKTLIKLGVKKLAFPTIVVAGKNGDQPHGIPSAYKIKDGDFITMDFGGVYKGYCGDMTRTIAIGHVTKKMKEVYNLVSQAQKAALDLVKKGVGFKDVDRAARELIEEAGYGQYYIHGTGHGIGRDVHEEPYLNTKATNREKLKSNMAITVEPGIYIPRKMGVRIEDLVIVTDFGVINTNRSPKELIVIK